MRMTPHVNIVASFRTSVCHLIKAYILLYFIKMCGHCYPFSLIFSHTVLLQWVHYSRYRFPPHTQSRNHLFSCVHVLELVKMKTD